jgi:hypothetical protein
VLSASIPFAARAVSIVSYALASMAVSRSSSDDKSSPITVERFIVVLGLSIWPPLRRRPLPGAAMPHRHAFN